MKNIYELDLHEFTRLSYDEGTTVVVFRVAGGWIYRFGPPSQRQTVFIPFDNEFQGQKPTT